MSKFKIINLIDKIFISVCVFLIIYAWLNFFTRNQWFSFLASIISSGAVLLLVFYLIEKNKLKRCSSKQRNDEIEKSFLCLKTMTINEKLEFVKSIVSTNSNAEIFNNSIVVKNEQNVQQIFIATNEKIISEETFFSIIENRIQDTNKIVIICENFNPTLNTKLLKNLAIEIVDRETLFDKYLSNTNEKLDTTILNEKSKKTIHQILSNLFIPIKAKQYFFCGLILIFSSLLLPYKTYYLIIGSLLLIFSILCKLQPIISNRFKSKN